MSGSDPLNLNAQLLIWHGSEDFVVRLTEIDPLENELQQLVLRHNNSLFIHIYWKPDQEILFSLLFSFRLSLASVDF